MSLSYRGCADLLGACKQRSSLLVWHGRVLADRRVGCSRLRWQQRAPGPTAPGRRSTAMLARVANLAGSSAGRDLVRRWHPACGGRRLR